MYTVGLYLIEHGHYSLSESTEISFWSEVGGLIGSIYCGLLAQKYGNVSTSLMFSTFGVVSSYILCNFDILFDCKDFALLLYRYACLIALFM